MHDFGSNKSIVYIKKKKVVKSGKLDTPSTFFVSAHSSGLVFIRNVMFQYTTFSIVNYIRYKYTLLQTTTMFFGTNDKLDDSL